MHFLVLEIKPSQYYNLILATNKLTIMTGNNVHFLILKVTKKLANLWWLNLGTESDLSSAWISYCEVLAIRLNLQSLSTKSTIPNIFNKKVWKRIIYCGIYNCLFIWICSSYPQNQQYQIVYLTKNVRIWRILQSKTFENKNEICNLMSVGSWSF